MNTKLAKEWLKSAFLDLKSIEYLINDELLTNIVSFHSQQAIEKSLKALLEYKLIDVPKTHKLQILFEKCKEYLNYEFDEDLIYILDDLYINSRYPSDLGLLPDGKPSIKQASEFYNFALDVYTKIEIIINNDNT